MVQRPSLPKKVEIDLSASTIYQMHISTAPLVYTNKYSRAHLVCPLQLARSYSGNTGTALYSEESKNVLLRPTVFCFYSIGGFSSI